MSTVRAFPPHYRTRHAILAELVCRRTARRIVLKQGATRIRHLMHLASGPLHNVRFHATEKLDVSLSLDIRWITVGDFPHHRVGTPRRSYKTSL
jgi:hypothetical protein